MEFGKMEKKSLIKNGGNNYLKIALISSSFLHTTITKLYQNSVEVEQFYDLMQADKFVLVDYQFTD